MSLMYFIFNNFFIYLCRFQWERFKQVFETNDCFLEQQSDMCVALYRSNLLAPHDTLDRAGQTLLLVGEIKLIQLFNG